MNEVKKKAGRHLSEGKKCGHDTYIDIYWTKIRKVVSTRADVNKMLRRQTHHNCLLNFSWVSFSNPAMKGKKLIPSLLRRAWSSLIVLGM